MKPHKENILYEIKPTCYQKGYKTFICEFCFEKVEKEVDIVPHNYLYSDFNPRTNRFKGICQYCKKENIKYFNSNYI